METGAPLSFALDYARRRWAVFPVHTPTPDGCSCAKGPDCPPKTRGKHPRTANGFKDATTNEKTIRRWWELWPDANIGIRTGEVSDLVVVDIDPRNGGHLTWEDLEAEHGRPDTAEVFTGGGGRHLYFTHAFTATKGTNALGPGVDIKTDGGYVVAPPSMHESGQAYMWEASETTPAELPVWVWSFERPEPEGKAEVGAYVPRRSTTPWDPTTPIDSFRSLNADRACAHALGIPVNETFSCILPGHGPDRNPSATVFIGRGGDLLYQCFHQGDLTLTLPQVRASLAFGTITRFKDDNGRGLAGEHVTWRLRLLYEAGVIDPKPMTHKPLSADAPPAARAVYDGFILLLGLKEHLWPGDPTTFSWRFAKAWCGVTERQAKDATQWLMSKGYIRKSGVSRGRFGKEIGLLRPARPLSQLSGTEIDIDAYKADLEEIGAWATGEQGEGENA